MIIKAEHFDAKETQLWFRLFLQIEGHQIGDEISNNDYLIWNRKQWQSFHKQNDYPENQILHHIENWEERFTLFLKAQLPSNGR